LSLITSIITDLQDRFGDQIIAIYGIGSYFDNSLPKDWIKNDIDLIVVLENLDSTSKKDWTTVKFEKKKRGEIDVWIGYNTLQGLLNKDIFQHESFSNYEWSIMELKDPSNSLFLYGEDIRDQLPDVTELRLDFDDILRRSLYHLDQSYKMEYRDDDIEPSKRAFTKSVFKFGFYLCAYYDKNFRSTSIRSISKQIGLLMEKDNIGKDFLLLLENCIIYRRKNVFQTDFHDSRKKFAKYVFSQLGKGALHRQMKYKELKKFLEKSFDGFSYLIQILEKVKKKYTLSKK
jgi:dGTP triphosphohydrolase